MSCITGRFAARVIGLSIGLVVAGIAARPAVAGSTPSFASSQLAGTDSGQGLSDPTSLQFGPDGRLYVAERYGFIHVYTVTRNGPSNYQVTDEEIIDLVRTIPNHNDDGTPNADPRRQTTGLLVTGTVANPVIYVTSSDWRVAVGIDSGLDTNSGIISRITWNGSAWEKLDIVRGLPRNEENHSTNGMQLDTATNTLYVAQGGHTNMGAPSNNFSFQPEYAYSAALLTVDLDAIGETTYDLPTLDDPERPGVDDLNDPFGGNNGNNMAVHVAGGPVQVFSPGFRNAYDLVLMQSGRIYTVDNGPNQGWGGPPIGCTLNTNEADSHSYGDGLHFVTGPGYYGGHPNTTRGNLANLFNGQSPILVPNPIECDYQQPGVDDAALHVFPASTNGTTEYTAGNFDGAMQGDLLTASWNGNIYRIELNAAGDVATNVTPIFSGFGAQPLDVIAQGDGGPFPGTVWIASFGSDIIVVQEPVDFIICTGRYDAGLDDDLDGYSNADEIDSGTDPCSAGSLPPDFDGDFVSDRNDLDDDDDGVPDLDDAFAHDPYDGLATAMPISYGWGGGEPGFGFFGLGFTGLMTNGATDYLDQYDPVNLTAGGAAGKFTIDEVPPGDALLNTQANAFQFGVNVTSASGPFLVRTRLDSPYFDGFVPETAQSWGLFIGDGGQDDYFKVVFGATGGGGFEVREERGGTIATSLDLAVPALLGSTFVEVDLRVDPLAGTVEPFYAIDGGAQMPIGGPFALGGGALAALQGGDALAVGIIATSRSSVPFAATWDYIDLVPLGSTASALVTIDPSGGSIDGSTYGAGSFKITNTSTGGQQIDAITFDLTGGVIPDMVFDPDGTAGDIVAKPFTINSNGGSGTIGHSFLNSFHNGVDPDDGYDELRVTYTQFEPGETMTFSIDNDPNSIKGTTAPGPNEAGSVSGLELTGTRVTVEFDDGTTHIGEVHRLGSTLDAAEIVVAASPPAAPVISIGGGGSANAQVASAGQVVRVAGPVGADVDVLVVEGCMFIDGTPNPMSGPYPNGYDIDPWEANSIVEVASTTATIGPQGFVDVPITLTRFAGDGSYTLGSLDVPGLNTMVAVVREADGRTGAHSNVVVLELIDADLDASPSGAGFGGVAVGTTSSLPITLTNLGASDLDVTGLAITGDAAFLITGAPSLPQTLAAGGPGVDVSVQFTPDVIAPFSGALEVTHTGNNSPLVVPLSGQGVGMQPGDGLVVHRLNCGGNQLAAADGSSVPWGADPGGAPSPFLFEGGDNTFSTASSITIGPGVRAAVPAALFQSERFDLDEVPEMRWSFPVDAGRTYEVRLYFAEIWSGANGPNLRVFDVKVEGAPWLTAFDPFAEAGGALNTGIVRSIVVVPTDSAIDIDFVHDVQNPTVKGIEIVRLNLAPIANDDVETVDQGGAIDVDILANDMDPDGVLDPGTVIIVDDPDHGSLSTNRKTGVITYQHDGLSADPDQFDYIVADDTGEPSNVATVSIDVVPGNPGPVVHRINCGGGPLLATDGSVPAWGPDSDAAPSPYQNGAGLTYATTASITLGGTVPPHVPAALFQTERFDLPEDADMAWSLPITAYATYEVRLFFAEIFNGAFTPGARVFTVLVEGRPVLVDFDQYTVAGAGNTGIMRRFVTRPTDSTIDIAFVHGVENPTIKGIEIRRIAPTSGPSGPYTHAPVFPFTRIVDLGPIDRIPVPRSPSNGSGQAAGTMGPDGAERAFRFTPGVGREDLGTLGGATSAAFAIAENGDVVGVSALPDGSLHGFLYARREMTDLGTLGGDYSEAFDVNERREVVGSSTTVDGVLHAFLWTPRRGMTDLNDLLPAGSPWELTAAYGITNDGHVTGVGRRNGRPRAFELSLDPSGAGLETARTDLDGDGRTGLADLTRLLQRWGQCDAPCGADLDGDGTVGYRDLAELLESWE